MGRHQRSYYGAIIDGSHLKLGKFKPWILIGAVTCGIVFVDVQHPFWMGWNLRHFYDNHVFPVRNNLTMNDIGYWSMLPSLSSHKRKKHGCHPYGDFRQRRGCGSRNSDFHDSGNGKRIQLGIHNYCGVFIGCQL